MIAVEKSLTPSIGDSTTDVLYYDDYTTSLLELITGGRCYPQDAKKDDKKLSHKQLAKLNSAERARYARDRSERR